MRIDVHPCGCCSNGFRCPDHRDPPQASDLAASVALALFIGAVAVWCAILA
jgi:hypothetical protein